MKIMKPKKIFITLAVIIFPVLITGLSRAAQSAAEQGRSVFNPRGLKDPFRPPGEEREKPSEDKKKVKPETKAEKPLPQMKLQGLIWGGKLPQAIVNGKVVKIGDIFEGARIDAIDRSGIVVWFNGRSYTISSPAGNASGNLKQKTQGGGTK
jgi:hypothetical protein